MEKCCKYLNKGYGAGYYICMFFIEPMPNSARCSICRYNSVKGDDKDDKSNRQASEKA